MKKERDYVINLVKGYDFLSKKLNKDSFSFGINKRNFRTKDID